MATRREPRSGRERLPRLARPVVLFRTTLVSASSIYWPVACAMIGSGEHCGVTSIRATIGKFDADGERMRFLVPTSLALRTPPERGSEDVHRPVPRLFRPLKVLSRKLRAPPTPAHCRPCPTLLTMKTTNVTQLAKSMSLACRHYLCSIPLSSRTT